MPEGIRMRSRLAPFNNSIWIVFSGSGGRGDGVGTEDDCVGVETAASTETLVFDVLGSESITGEGVGLAGRW